MEEAVKAKTIPRWSENAAAAAGLVLCVVLGLMLLCNLTIIVRGTLDPERPPAVMGLTPLVVLSGSMSGEQEGHIEVGDLIFVAQADPAELEAGDVIAFMSGQTVVTHRIVRVETAADGSLQYITKGDANNAEDTDPVPADQLVGVYQGRIPKAGDFALFLQEPLGMMLFVGGPLLGFVLYDIIRRQRYAIQEKKKASEMEQELARLRAMTGESNLPAPGAEP